jgi:hypothetical protein
MVEGRTRINRGRFKGMKGKKIKRGRGREREGKKKRRERREKRKGREEGTDGGEHRGDDPRTSDLLKQAKGKPI